MAAIAPNGFPAISESQLLADMDSEHRVRAGLVDRMELVNFMCHAQLAIDLKPSVNFIVGQNGSGKSAICAALQVALGAKASETDRGTSMAQFIRTGANAALIRITLLNIGRDAFKPAAYGTRIVIERRLAQSGSMSTSLWGDSKHGSDKDPVVSGAAAKAEVAAVTEHFNLNVANPAVVVPQEKFKALATASPEARYDWLLKASQLDAAMKELKKALHQREITTQSLANQTAVLEAAKARLRTATAAADESRELQRIRVQLRELHALLRWAEYTDKKRAALANLKAESQARTQAVNTAMANKEQAEAHRASLVQQIALAQQQYDAWQSQVEAAQEEYETRQSDLTAAQQPVADAEAELRVASMQLSQAVAHVRAVAHEVRAAEARRDSNAYSEALAKYKAKLQQLNDSISAAQEAHPALQAAVDEASAGINAARATAEAAGAAHAHASRLLRDAEQRVQGLTGGSSTRMPPGLLPEQVHAAIGRFSPQVQAAAVAAAKLTQSRRTSGPVLGPIGAYISLVGQSNTALALEAMLSPPLLETFIVCNVQDGAMLEKAAKQHAPRARVRYVTYPAAARLPAQLPRPKSGSEEVQCMADLLEFHDERVRTFVMDSLTPFRFGLVNSAERDGYPIFARAEAGEPAALAVMQSYDRLFDLDGHYIAKKGGSEMYMPFRLYDSAKFLFQDVAQALQRASADVEQLTHQVSNAANNRNAATAAVQAVKSKLAKAQAQLNSNARTGAAAEQQLAGLAPPQPPPEASVLVAAVTAATAKLEAAQQNEQAARELTEQRDEELNAARAVLQPIQAAAVAANKRITDLLSQNPSAQADLQRRQLSDCEQALANATLMLHTAHQRLQELGASVAAAQASLTKEAEDLKQSTGIGPPAHPRPAAELRMQCGELEQRGHVLSSRTSITAEEMDRRLHEQTDAQALVDKLGTAHENLQGVLDQLSSGQQEKAMAWQHKRLQIADQLAKTFQLCTRRRGIHGECRVVPPGKDNAGRVELKVDPNMFSHSGTPGSAPRSSQGGGLDLGGSLEDATDSSAVASDSSEDSDYGAASSAGQKRRRRGRPAAKPTARNRKDGATASLSGGERSFTALSLLLALGATADTPLRVIDEFDVFCDESTRKQSVNMLLNNALREEGIRQSILITPHDVSMALQGYRGDVNVFIMPTTR